MGFGGAAKPVKAVINKAAISVCLIRDPLSYIQYEWTAHAMLCTWAAVPPLVFVSFTKQPIYNAAPADMHAFVSIYD